MIHAAGAHASLGAVLRDLRDLRNPSVGRYVWGRFKVGRADSLCFYDRIAEAVSEGLPDEPLAVSGRDRAHSAKRPPGLSSPHA